MADTCKSCGAAVRWMMTPKGKAIPLDPQPRDDGNLVIIGSLAWKSDGTPGPRYVSHFATCPYADQHRKRGK